MQNTFRYSEPMQNLERLVNLLSSFGNGRAEMPVKTLLAELSIPVSSGYKLIGALVGEGFLERREHGVVALGPAASAFLFASVKALPASESAAAFSVATAAGFGGRLASRMTQWTPTLLDLVSTTRYRKAPPFTIGFLNASTSSPWRRAMEGSLKAAALRQRGVVSHLLVRNAEDDPGRQVEQLAEMERAGVDLCILSAASVSDTGLAGAVHRLSESGMPIVGVDRQCGDPRDLVSFVTASDVLVGRMSALWLAEHLGGKGKVLMLCGREDASPCKVRLQAAMEIFSLHPRIDIVAVEFTNWEADVGFDTVKRHLAAGVVPDGVWCDSGLQGAGSLRAFRDAGYKRGTVPPHTGSEINLTYKLAFQDKVPLCGVDYPAAMGALSFQTALDILFGRQVPRRLESNLEIIVSRGHETPSVRADYFIEERVRWDRDDNYVHASGWIPGASHDDKDFFS